LAGLAANVIRDNLSSATSIASSGERGFTVAP
jgi:hypothetical protein